MNRNCSRCGNEIIELNLSDEQVVEIWGLQRQDLKLFIVKKFKDEFGFSHSEAKFIMDHLNPEIGQCQRCDFDGLDGEYVDCPKCKAFNYNVNLESPFNQDFCSQLEYSLDFEQLDREDLKGYWCDGVDHLPKDIKSLAKSRIEKERTIVTKAWIGRDGQGEYEMTINLGGDFIKAYMSDSNLLASIPGREEKGWIDVDTEQRKVEIKLK